MAIKELVTEKTKKVGLLSLSLGCSYGSRGGHATVGGSNGLVTIKSVLERLAEKGRFFNCVRNWWLSFGREGFHRLAR